VRRSVLVTLLVVVLGGAAATALVSLSQTSAGAIAVRAAALPPIRVSTALPSWRAPGGRLVLVGRALARERVALLARGVRIGLVRADRRGVFRLQVRVPALSGAYPLTLVASGRFRELGVLRVRPLVLAAVGDVSFGEGVGRLIDSYGVAFPWRSVGAALRSADLATANLEGAVSTRGVAVAGKEYTFRGPPAALAATARAGGLDILTVANNHSLDFGSDAFFDTLRLAHRVGIATVGGGAGLAAARRPVVFDRGGLRVAFLGYSDVRPLGFTAAEGVPGTAPAFPDEISADVRAARKRADVVVVWFHWGVERMTVPDSRQRELASAALAAGATVVLGAHPHVLQPVERRGHTLVAWSLGNFLFTASSPGTQRTGILDADLGAAGVLGFRLRPVTIVDSRPVLDARVGSAHENRAASR
jgi:poly-gamma-glutamate synthesis protein (capsule biosynthesis protein)